MKKTKIITRRAFVKGSLQASAGLMIAGGIPELLHMLGVSSVKPGLAFGAGKPRRHLIHLVDNGGWDSYWHHNSDPGSDRFRAPGAPFGGQSRPDYLVSPVMGRLWSQSDLSKLLIWRGIEKQGEHGVSNKLQYTGGLSAYASAYSAVIAKFLAEHDYPRTLHYVQLSDTNLVPVGNLGGYAVSSNIGGPQSWKNITSPWALRGGRSMGVTTAVEKLSTGLSQKVFQRQASRDAYQNFLVSFQSAIALGGSNYADSPEFIGIWRKYFDVIYGDVRTLVNSAGDILAPKMVSTDPNTPFINSCFYGPYYTTGTNLTGEMLIPTGNTDSHFIKQIVSAAWNFAMAEFLISRDLTAVIDIPVPAGDGHQSLAGDLMTRLIGMSGFKGLIRSLDSYQVDDGLGQKTSLLNLTTLTYDSDFDRTQEFQDLAAGQAAPADLRGKAWGTNHGRALSVLMAGMGVRSGTIVGATIDPRFGANWAPQAKYIDKNYGAPIPIDPTNGAPYPSGGFVPTGQNLLPTICDMFSAPVPDQQITEFKKVAAVIDPAKKRFAA